MSREDKITLQNNVISGRRPSWEVWWEIMKMSTFSTFSLLYLLTHYRTQLETHPLLLLSCCSTELSCGWWESMPLAKKQLSSLALSSSCLMIYPRNGTRFSHAFQRIRENSRNRVDGWNCRATVGDRKCWRGGGGCKRRCTLALWLNGIIEFPN